MCHRFKNIFTEAMMCYCKKIFYDLSDTQVNKSQCLYNRFCVHAIRLVHFRKTNLQNPRQESFPTSF